MARTRKRLRRTRTRTALVNNDIQTRIAVFRHLIRSEAVEIEAPIDRVWSILVDFERYGEWNPFTTRVDGDPEVGAPVDLHVTLGSLRVVQPERIEAVEGPQLLAWGMRMGHRLLLSARRDQHLEPLGATRCRYHTTDALRGLHTPLVVLLFGRLIRRGFNDMARALKARAEDPSVH